MTQASMPRSCVTHLDARTGSHPTTRAQEGLWAWRDTRPDSAGTTVVHTLRLDGQLDHDRLRTALTKVVTRHEALRTTFATDGADRLRQVVHLPAPAELFVHPVPDVATAKERAAAWTRHRFDVCDRCWAAELVVTAAGSAVLVLAADSMVFDSRSAELFATDLAHAYAEPSSGTTSRAPGAHPVDAASRQRTLLDSDEGSRLRAHWHSTLEGSAEQPGLPEPLTVAASHTPRTMARGVPLAPETSAALRAIASTEGSDPFVTVAAAFSAFLYRRGMGPENTVSVVTTRRDAFDAAAAIGYFDNLVPVRDRIEDHTPFRRHLGAFADRVRHAVDHGDLPYEEMVRELPMRSGSVAAPGRVVVARAARRITVPATDDFIVGLQPGAPLSAPYDFLLEVEEGDDGLTLRCHCDPARLLAGTQDRMAEGFGAFLAAVAAAPDAAIGELPAMGTAEWAQVIETARPSVLPSEHTLLALFDRQAAACPEATAVVDDGQKVSYGELARRAYGLAAMVAPGLGDQEHPVVVALPKSGDLIAALVSTHVLGSFYLPLDPAHVPSRLSGLVQQSGARVVITRSDVIAGVELPDGVRTVLLDRDAIPDIAATSPAGITPASLAYVMPTSGTTGEPKLVGIPHRAVVRLAYDSTTLPLGPQDATMLVANTSFDAATLEVWGALCNGGRIVVPDPGELEDPVLLCRAIERHAITTGFFTVTLFARMVEAEPHRLAGMRHLLVGGEAVPPELFAEAARHLPQDILMNGYGPTENTTFSCCYRLDRDPEALRSVPIGHAVHGSTAFVVDERLQLLPVGAVGELVVGGAGLAAGYLNDEELTAERFPVLPWATAERVYRTGDFGRLLPDSTLEYLGRRDRQLKIRGFRIEAGEVERVLCGHPAVRRAAVFAIGSLSGRQLGTAVERSAAARLTEAELRTWIAGRLPSYMVPARLTVYTDLPLTANGKVDFAALATAERGRRWQTPPVLPPTSVWERTVAEVFGEVLGTDTIGLDDNFFDCGGDSIGAQALSARLGRRLQRSVPARLVFEYPTVRALSDQLTPQRPQDDRQELLRRVTAARAAIGRRGRAGGRLLPVPQHHTRTEPSNDAGPSHAN
ncbi:amino acid adenylation domain-containing protein [[Kitasatospora] papulosa]|uniref:non-ribosomal peptide synthetase n=1 Tax=[Kitasatospora] papulosa TaxID=1464011 RepID=UPI0036BC8963